MTAADRRLPGIVSETTSGIVTKLLVDVGGAGAEVVAVRRPDKDIVCFSTQVGCAMSCSFCVSGASRHVRSLSVDEMTGLVEVALGRCGSSGNGVVLSAMGEGEPALNAEATVATLEGFHRSGRAAKLALSTVGPSPGKLRGLVRRIADSGLPIKVQFSLHAARADLRRSLVGTSKVDPDEALSILLGRVPALELNVVLLEGVNDAPEDARALVDLLRGRNTGSFLVKVNEFNRSDVVPFAPSRPDRKRVYLDLLAEAGVPFETYATDGAEISAACGQLRHAATALKAA